MPSALFARRQAGELRPRSLDALAPYERRAFDALLIFPVGLLAVGLVLLALARSQIVAWQTLTGALVFALALLGASLWVRWRLKTADPFLLAVAATLAAVGQIMTSRLEPGLGPRQGGWGLIGLGAATPVGLL